MLLGEGETGPNGYRRSLETTWSPNAETDIAVQGTSSMQGPAVSFPDRERDLVIRKRILNYGWGRALRLDSSSATEPRRGGGNHNPATKESHPVYSRMVLDL